MDIFFWLADIWDGWLACCTYAMLLLAKKFLVEVFSETYILLRMELFLVLLICRFGMISLFCKLKIVEATMISWTMHTCDVLKSSWYFGFWFCYTILCLNVWFFIKLLPSGSSFPKVPSFCSKSFTVTGSCYKLMVWEPWGMI